MSIPTLVIRIGLASNPLDNPQTWTDVSTDGVSIYINKGRQHALDRIEASTAQVILKNLSNQYYPASNANIKPGKCINIRATYSGTTYDLFTGFIESWRPSWLSDSGRIPIVTLECADLIKNLSRFEITDGTGYSPELTGARVDNVLDSFGWPVALTDLDTGISTMQATGALTSANAMNHLFTIMESERGQFFIAGDGHVQFQDRHARLKSPLNTSQATFGDDTGEMSYRKLEPFYDDKFIYNNIVLTRSGGSAQTVNDTTSQTSYGKRSLSKIGLLMATDGDALSQAQYLIGRYKDANLRIGAITIYPQRDEANLYPKILGYDISTRITLRLNQAALDTDYHIEGISHNCDSRSGIWVTKWQLSDANNQEYWILGTSELGTNTRLCY